MAKKPTRPAAKDPIWFEKPTVTDRLIMVKGPSGWLETFPRKALDAALEKFLGALPVDDAVALFVLQRETSEDTKATRWETVVGFLGRLFDISPFDVPPEVGLAFWGRVELELRIRGVN